MVDKELFEKYKPQRNELNKLFYTDKNYDLCLKNTKEFESYLEQSGIVDKHLYQFIYMMLSKSHYRLKNIAQAIKYAKLAEKFSSDDYELNLSYWQLANCYFDINKNKVLFYYTMCEEYYKEKNDLFCLAQILCNKAELLNDENMAIKAIKLYKQVDDFSKYGYLKQDLFDKKYEILFNIYISGHSINKYNKAWSLLHKITDVKLKNKLSNQMLMQTKIA